jgi:acetyl esterase/lipase
MKMSNEVVIKQIKVIPLLLTFIACLLSAQEGDEYTAIPRDTSYTISSVFKKLNVDYPFIKIVYPTLPEGVSSEKDLVYISYGKRNLHLDLFCPKNSTTPKPAVILVHGGGWRSGDKSLQIPMAQQLAARGYVTAAVEYRLSPEAKFPAAVYDLKAAIRWMRTNALQYHIDPNRIAILGCSSGGQLAALIGTTNDVDKFSGVSQHETKSSDVQAIIDVDGILDFTSEEARKYEDDPTKNPSSAGAWFGGRYNEKPNLWKEASPLYHVNEKTPPILFINSAIARFHVGRDEMIEKLKQFNIYYDVNTIPDTPHSFWLFHPWFEQTLKYTSDFLDKCFVEID